MKRRVPAACIARLVSLVALGACTASCGSPDAGAAAVGVRVISDRAFAYCPLKEPDAAPALHVLDGAADWSARVAGGEAQTLGRAVDWKQTRVVVASMGRAPTGGWSVALDRRELAARQGELILPLKRIAPPADAMVTQALTMPCLFIVLPRAYWQRAKPAWQG